MFDKLKLVLRPPAGRGRVSGDAPADIAPLLLGVSLSGGQVQMVCKDCGKAKPITEFYKNHSYASGYRNQCKECSNNYILDHYRRFPEKIKAKRRRWRDKNKEKVKCHNLLNRAVQCGRVIRPSKCELCGNEGKIHGHHEDYSKPYEVKWLCVKCHIRMPHDIYYFGEIVW
jgi:hypothetical protein